MEQTGHAEHSGGLSPLARRGVLGASADDEQQGRDGGEGTDPQGAAGQGDDGAGGFTVASSEGAPRSPVRDALSVKRAGAT
ncbi:hypothetical protein STEPF1_04400 [Streptomyces sp. F-1]|nr:hypothetical protein STEPF1_04400 [Streptomyces sp. F-1]